MRRPLCTTYYTRAVDKRTRNATEPPLHAYRQTPLYYTLRLEKRSRALAIVTRYIVYTRFWQFWQITGHQTAVHVLTSLKVCFCTTSGKQDKSNTTFFLSKSCSINLHDDTFVLAWESLQQFPDPVAGYGKKGREEKREERKKRKRGEEM